MQGCLYNDLINHRVKILLQTQHVNAALARPYSGPTDCVIRVYQEQGFVSFWRGNMANLLRYFPNHAMNFAFKDRYKNTFVGNATATNDVSWPFYLQHPEKPPNIISKQL